jgi:methionyl-tRNA formyltransferase
MPRSHKPFIYFGTPYVGRDTLALLVERGFMPELVVTSPDAPRGRGLTLTPCETKAWAVEHGLPVFTPDTLDDAALEEIKNVGAEYAIVVAYGKILPQALIDAFPLGILNIHYSLLPKYRGASPVEAALLQGDTVTGVTIQKMAFALDAGDILAQKGVEILPDETTRELRPRLVREGAELLAGVLPSFENGTAEFAPQDHGLATRAGKIKKEDGLLTLGEDAANWNKYRAYAESPGTYFFVTKGGRQMRVKVVTAAMRDGTFTPLRVVPEGKKETDYAEFSRTL